MAPEAPGGGLTRLCDGCFWVAQLTVGAPQIWCSHSRWHGWHTEPVCNGTAFRPESDRRGTDPCPLG